MEVKCPQCGTKTLFSPENSFRPFCSERCRLIDLGEWASGSYRIPIPGDETNLGLESEDENDLKTNKENESEGDS